MAEQNDLVLVTGASGFLASHIVKQLLELGYRVRGTVRSLKDEKKVAPLRKLVENPKHELELVEADLLNESSWLNAVKDCTFVLHTASPVPVTVPRDEKEVIEPAVNGTLFVLRACAQPESLVKRVVLTSSLAAIAGDVFETDKLYSEKDFSVALNSQPYTKSKILAEKTAWDFVKEKNSFQLSVINPGFIIGPCLTDVVCASMELPKRLLEKGIPMLPDVVLPGIDVRDVALAHIKAMTSVEALSNRHMLIANKEANTMQEYAQWLKEEFEPKGYSICTRVAPNFLLKLYSYFDRPVTFLLPILGKRPKFDNSKMKEVFQIEPRDVKKAFVEMAQTMIERGIAKRIN